MESLWVLKLAFHKRALRESQIILEYSRLEYVIVMQ